MFPLGSAYFTTQQKKGAVARPFFGIAAEGLLDHAYLIART
jgi:hypothetical protein